MPRSAPLQPRFDLFFEVANNKLSQTGSPVNDIMISRSLKL
jgi:hypothetical protein